MSKRKAISPVVATALLLVVAVVAVVGFQGWFQQYSSDILSSTEQQGSLADLEINSISGSGIYVRNSAETSLNITELKVDGVSCNVSSTLSGKDTSFIDVGPCLDEKEGEVEVVLISSGGDLQTKKLYMGYRWEQPYVPQGTLVGMHTCPDGWTEEDFYRATDGITVGFDLYNGSEDTVLMCAPPQNVSEIPQGSIVMGKSCSGGFDEVGTVDASSVANIYCLDKEGQNESCYACKSKGNSIDDNFKFVTNASCPESWQKYSETNISDDVSSTCDSSGDRCWICSPQ